MAIKIAISLTALSLIQIGMAEVWDRKGSAPNVGQDRQAHYLFIPHHCRITARWVGRGVVACLVWWAVVQWHERAQYKAETFAFFAILQHPQAIDAYPTPNSLSWHGKTLGLLGLEA